MSARRARCAVVPRGRLLKDGSHVWRVGPVGAPLAFPPSGSRERPRAGRFDDPLGEYSVLYCAAFQSVALRETLQHFRYDSATLARLRDVRGDGPVPPARVPADWRSARVLAPGRIRLAEGGDLAAYESPELLRTLEEGFAQLLSDLDIPHLDVPVLRSKERAVSQLFGRSLYNQGFAGIAFRSSVPPGGVCAALFEQRASLEPDGKPRALTANVPALRTVSEEFGLKL